MAAGRTELAVAALAAKVIGVDLQSPNFGLTAFSYALWGMAFNNMGWMVVSLFATCRMDAVIKKINQKYDVKWVENADGGCHHGLVWINFVRRRCEYQ